MAENYLGMCEKYKEFHISWRNSGAHSFVFEIRDNSVRGVYAPRFRSCHNKDFEWRTLKPPQCVTALGSWTDRVIALRSRTDPVIALRKISVTALFYLEDRRKIHLQHLRACWSKDSKRRAPQCVGWGGGGRGGERESPLAPLLICFFLPPGPVLSKLALVRSAVLPEVLTLVLGSSFDLPLFYFHELFPSLSFSHRHFGLLFPILTT